MTLGGRRVMLDCGMHMGYQDDRRFPDWAMLAPAKESLAGILDCVIISHFHLDHCGALPQLTEVMKYDGPIFMTTPTAALASVLLKDYAQIMATRDKWRSMYTLADVHACLRRVTPLALGETVWVDEQLSFQAHHAGHVLGAVMISVQCLGQRVLYTGDFSLAGDRHMGATRVDIAEPHLLITESTYATSTHESSRCREAEMLRIIHSAVAEGGKVLIPTFAVGRAQVSCVYKRTQP